MCHYGCVVFNACLSVFTGNLVIVCSSSHGTYTYLRVLLDKHLSWSPHVSKITGKAFRTLNFLKRNLSNYCSTQVKAAAYLAMVRPQLEYASVVWDPIYNSDVHKLENIEEEQQDGY